MRVTNNMMSASYLKNLNASANELNNSNTKISAKRQYMSISEDPSRALKAMQVRKILDRIDVNTNNLTDALGVLDQYETVIASINSIVTEASTLVSQAITSTSGEMAMKTIANSLRGFQEAIMSAANTKYAGDYVFSGSETSIIPFSVDEEGNLLYKGVDVETGTFEEENRYIDIGIGLKTDSSNNVLPNSAMDVANSGVKLLGSGKDENGITNNLYNLLGNIADMLESGDIEDISDYIGKLTEKADDIRFQYVNVGSKTNFISYFTERLESEQDNAIKRQSDLESLDYAEGIIEFYDLQTAYNACLQMGTKILQPSLLDFLN